MAEAARTTATYQDVIDAPPHMVAEIIDGELVLMPRPAPRHSVSSNGLSYELTGPFQRGVDGPGGWIFMIEPELHFGLQVVVPDIAGWRLERMKTMPETAYIEIAPDWVCEVTSKSTERYDRGAKRRIYWEAGVKHLWLLNPSSQFLETFVAGESDWQLGETIAAGEDVSAAPFDAISFPLDNLWGLPDAESAS